MVKRVGVHSPPHSIQNLRMAMEGWIYVSVRSIWYDGRAMRMRMHNGFPTRMGICSVCQDNADGLGYVMPIKVFDGMCGVDVDSGCQ